MSNSTEIENAETTATRILQGYPGAAIFISANGEIKAKNSRADDFISSFRNGDLQEMWSLIERARLTGSITAGSVMMPTGTGDVMVEVVIIPGVSEEPLLLLARMRNREKLLDQIITSVRNEVDPQNMLEVAVISAARIFNAVGCRIYRRFESGHFQIAADYGNTEKLDDLDEAIAGLGNVSEIQALKLRRWQALVATTHYRKSVNGAICIWKNLGEEWIEEERILIADVADQLGIANQQVTAHEQMLALSRTDPMTGLLNRRSFLEDELPRRVARLQHNRQTAALFYVDMDNFKQVNDIRGHQAGDDAIMYLRDMLMDFTRPADVIARLGGDEFAMWLDDILPDVAEARANDLIKASKSMEQFSGNPKNPLGISVGIAVYKPDQNESLDDLLARADNAMYVVKREGKGGFHVARDPGSNQKGIQTKPRRKKYGVEVSTP